MTPPRLTMDLTSDSAIEADGVVAEDLALRRVANVRRSLARCRKGWPRDFRKLLLREMERQAGHISFAAMGSAVQSDLPDREQIRARR